MRASIVIASRNEGDCLRKTVRACIDSTADFHYEIVVADDASDDGSVDELQRQFPGVRVVRHEQRQGVAPTKDLGARHARGDVLVFLDGHCNPEPGAISRLVADVEQLQGSAAVAPRVPLLDCTSWQNSQTTCGNGYVLELETFEQRWALLPDLRRHGHFIESPNLVGCCFAVSRELYENLGGFDCHMRGWGSEQVDFGLTIWLTGYCVFNDLEAVIGHRFQPDDRCDLPRPQIVANELRMARKHFTESTWTDWFDRYQRRHTGELWQQAWKIFVDERENVEQQRDKLMARRVRDEFWYAHKFDMDWPLSLLSKPSLPPWLQDGNGNTHRLSAEPDAVGFARRHEGPSLTLFLKIGQRLWGDLDIEEAAVRCEGTDELATCAALLVHKIEGRTLQKARSLELEHLKGRLPAENRWETAAELCISALRDALRHIDNSCVSGKTTP